MPSESKGNIATEANVSPNQAEETAEASVRNAAREDKIRLRAYEIYLERGAEPGREVDDWLQAERELERGSPSAGAGRLGSESATSIKKKRASRRRARH